MNRIVSLVKWLAAAALVLSAGQALAAWKVRYDYSEGDDRGVAVATDASGNIYALIAAEGDDNEAVVIVSYNQSGNELETWEYDPEAPDYDDYIPSCFVVTGPGTDVRIYASVYNATQDAWRVVAFGFVQGEPTVLWSSSFAVEDIAGEIADIALQWYEGAWGVVATGNADRKLVPTKGEDWLTISYRPDGTQRWHHFLDGEYELDDLAKAVACNDNSDVFVTGQATILDGVDDDAVIRTVKYLAAGSEPTWVANRDKVTGDDDEDEGLDVVADVGTYVYVAAKYYIERETPPSTYGTVILRYNQGDPGILTEAEVKHDYYSYVPVELAYYNNEQSACGVFAAVSKWAEPAESYYERHFTTIRFENSENGLNKWQLDFSVGPTIEGDEHAPCGVAATNNVCCYVTGNITDRGGDIATLMYSADGLRKELWQAYDGGLDQAADVTAYLLTTGAANVAIVGTVPGDVVDTDALIGLYNVPPQWHWEEPLDASGNKKSIPYALKPVKDGGWLVYCPDGDFIYASRGNKLTGFYRTRPGAGGEWDLLGPWLLGTEGKPPSKGSAGCADSNGVIYATKGNNKSGFWKYTASTNAWTQLLDVPLGVSNKKVKGGTGIAFAYKAGVGSPYLLKGYKNEFYRYDIATNAWQTLPDAPIGANQKWDKGSWLVSDGQHTLYAHKAKRNEFYSFNTETEVWSGQLIGMPTSGTGGVKKAKDGSCGAWLDDCIYALKGGNTQEFWKCTFTTDGNSWTEQEPLPMGSFKKKVKAGGSITSDGSVLFALKGNKCNEFWRYVPSSGGLNAGAPIPGGSVVASGGTTLDGETPLTDGLEASKPRWNPQGNRVCYSKEDTLTGYEAIYQCYYGLPIPEEKVTDMLEHCEEPVYSPNGSYIAFQVDDTVSDFYQLCVTTTSGGGGAGCGTDEVPEEPADITDAAGTATAVAPVRAVSAGSVIAGSIIASRPVWQITFADEDHCYPEWSPDGQWLCYERDDDNGYTQIWRVPAFGGQEQQLTFGNSDHFLPIYLNSNEIVFILSPNNDYDVVGKVNVSTHQAAVVSNFQTDHDRPSPACNGNSVVAEALDDAGNTQIVKIPIWVGSEYWLTSGTSDIMEPDYSQDRKSTRLNSSH